MSEDGRIGAFVGRIDAGNRISLLLEFFEEQPLTAAHLDERVIDKVTVYEGKNGIQMGLKGAAVSLFVLMVRVVHQQCWIEVMVRYKAGSEVMDEAHIAGLAGAGGGLRMIHAVLEDRQALAAVEFDLLGIHEARQRRR